MRALLLALLVEKAMHGYALARLLEERAAGALKIREGSLYPALHELELEGIVEASWEKAPDGRKRRIYSLTRPGRREARGARKEWLAIAELLRTLLGPREA